MKPKTCQYCDLDVPIKMFQDHLQICQSRTQNCDKCFKPISKKNFQEHRNICKGKVSSIKKQQINNRESLANFELEDSLTRLEQESRKKIKYDKAFKRQKEKVGQKKEQNIVSRNKKIEQSEKINPKSPKKNSRLHQSEMSLDWNEDFLHQHFLRNDSSSFFNFGDFYQDSFDVSPYQQELIFSSFKREIPSRQKQIVSSNDYQEDITIEDQLLQQTLFQNSKKSRISNKKQLLSNIPKDLQSEDIMNSSFYTKDILDIEKQRAIEKQIQMKKSSKINKKR